jgi:anti-sigma factor RsiW
MSCEEATRRIEEAAVSELREIERELGEHLASCPRCTLRLRLRRLAGEALESGSPRPEVDPAFERRVMAGIERENARTGRELSPRRGVGGLLRPGPIWAAVALLLLLLAGYVYLRTLGYFLPTGEMPADMASLIDDVGHDSYLFAPGPQTLEVATSDPGQIERWFTSRLDFPVHVPDRLDGGFDLLGARLWHTVSRLAALVQYESSDGNRVSLYLVSARNLADHGGRIVQRGDRSYRLGESFGYNVVAWREGGIAYGLTGLIPHERLVELAEVIRS